MNRSMYKSIKKEREKQEKSDSGKIGPIKRRKENPIETLFEFKEGVYRWDKTKGIVQLELAFVNASGNNFTAKWIAEKSQKFTETKMQIDGEKYDITEGLDRILATKYKQLDKDLLEAYVEYTHSERNVRHVLVFMIQRMAMEKLAKRLKERVEIEKVEFVETQGDKEILEWSIKIEGNKLKIKTEFVLNQRTIEMNFLTKQAEQMNLITALEQTLPEGVKYRRLVPNLKNEFREVEFGKEMLLVLLIERFEHTEFYRLRAIFDEDVPQRFKWLKRAAKMNY